MFVVDEDKAYEEWRENCAEELNDAIRAVVKRFVEDRRHYYRDNPRRAFEHIKSFAQAQLRYMEDAHGKNVPSDAR